jgi:uncharacterized protein involved in outer membrane biogenesis
MSRRRKSMAVIAGAVLAALALLVALFDWSWFKRPLQALASSQLDRKVEITGDIDGELSLTPRFSFEGVRVANTPWGSHPTMLNAEQMAFEINLPALLGGRLVLPEITLRAPDILVERDEEGALNWQVGTGSDEPGAAPEIGKLWVQNARISYRGPAEGEIQAKLATLRGSGGLEGNRATLYGIGSLVGLPLRLDVEAGSLDELQAGGEPYPLDVALDVGGISAALEGTIEEPLTLAAADLGFRLESQDPAPILAAAGLAPEPVPPLSLTGRILHERESWQVQDLQAHLGESTLSGQAGIDLGEQPPLLTADLNSDRLDVAALRNLYERIAPSSMPDERQEAQPIWSAEHGLKLDLLPDLQLDVAFDARDVRAQDLHLRELHLEASLQDDTPRLQLDGRGDYRDEALLVEVSAGSDASTSGPFRLESRLEVGANMARLSGSMDGPFSLAGLEMTFDVESPRPSMLLELAGLPSLQIPDLTLAGTVTHEGARWQIEGLSARLGQSDIAGNLTLDAAGGTRRLSADMHSESVNIADLRPLVSPRTEAVAEVIAEEAVEELPVPAPAAGPDQRLITLDGINRSALPDLQAEVRYTLERLIGPQIEIEDGRLRGRLQDQILAADLSGHGQIQGEPLDLTFQLGTLEGQPSTESAYPIEAHLEAGETTIDINGQLGEAMRFGEGRITFEMASPTPDRWLALAGLPEAGIPQVRAMGELVREGERWRLPDLYLELGESNLFGTASADLSRERPLLTAELQSNRLLFSDLMPTQDITGGEEAAEETPEQPPPISARGVNLEGLPEIDADLALDAEYVRLPDEVVFEGLAADLRLRNQLIVLDVSGEGKYGESPLSLEAHLGAPENLRDPNARYPVEVNLTSEVTKAVVSGSVAEPQTFSDLNIDVLLEGPNLGRLGQILQLSLPETPPYRLAGNLTHEGTRWRLGSLDGRIADSDIHGSTAIDLGDKRPMIVADLRSERLDFDDLGVLVGAPPDVGAGETASQGQERRALREAAEPGLLPDKEFDLPDMRAVDARVTYAAKSIEAHELPLEGVALELRLEDGLLRIDPLRFDAARGAVAASARLDVRQDLIGAQLDLRVREIDINVLLKQVGAELPQLEVEEGGRGTISGRAELEARGNSIKQMAGALEGDLVLVAEGGRINALLVEAAGLDLGEILALLVTGEEGGEDMVPILCLVVKTPVSQGVARLDPLLVDTTDSTIAGAGTIDLDAERLDLRLAAAPKDVSLLSANVPVRVTGSFTDVEIEILAEEILEQGFIDLGLIEDVRCQAVLESAREELGQMSDAPASEP